MLFFVAVVMAGSDGNILFMTRPGVSDVGILFTTVLVTVSGDSTMFMAT